MSSLERREKILSNFDTPNINACRSLQKAPQSPVNIVSTGNKRKKTT